ncbi:MAG TPA: glycosyltransferase family 4 protein [Thermoanaerobaculia bacterium]
MRVSYGFADLAGPGGYAEGGLVKFQALLPSWPHTALGYDVLYVVSSRLPAGIFQLYEEARAAGARVLLSQAAAACPATHGERWKGLNAPLEFLVEHADFVFYQSSFGRRMCDALLGHRQGPAEVLPNAVDTDRFHPAAADPAPGELRVLLGGTQYREYRLRRALEAFAIVARRRPDARLWVTGRLKWLPDLDEARRCAETWCRELGIADRVDFLGPYRQEDAPGIFRRAHVLLHTMALDCCPTVVLEAMASGLPVVYGASGGVPELVGANAGVGIPLDDDLEQLRVPDAAALAEAILIAAERKQELGEAGRQRAVERFGRGAWIARHRELFASWKM